MLCYVQLTICRLFVDVDLMLYVRAGGHEVCEAEVGERGDRHRHRHQDELGEEGSTRSKESCHFLLPALRNMM